MPGGDGTGPMGAGPMTGRAAGYCAGYAVPGFTNPVPGRGFGFGGGRGWGRGGGRGFGWGRGGGRGFGWGRGFGGGAAGYPAYAPDAAPYAAAYAAPYAPAYAAPAVAPGVDLEALKAQAEYLENALADIRRRVEEIESAGAGSK